VRSILVALAGSPSSEPATTLWLGWVARFDALGGCSVPAFVGA